METTRQVFTCDHPHCERWFVDISSRSDYYTIEKKWKDLRQPDVYRFGCECIGCQEHMCFQHSYTFKMNMSHEIEYTPLCCKCYSKLIKLFELDTLLQLANIIIEKPERTDQKLLDSGDDAATILEQLELE